MLISPAFAAEAATQTAAGGDIMGALSSFLPLITVLFVFYFLVIRPQNARLQAHRAMLAALKKGDKVVTGGGLVATIVKAEEGAAEVTLRLAEGVEVSALRSTLSGLHKSA